MAQGMTTTRLLIGRASPLFIAKKREKKNIWSLRTEDRLPTTCMHHLLGAMIRKSMSIQNMELLRHSLASHADWQGEQQGTLPMGHRAVSLFSLLSLSLFTCQFATPSIMRGCYTTASLGKCACASATSGHHI